MELKRPAMRNMLSALWCLAVAALLDPLAAAPLPSDDDLFTSTNVPSIAIEIPEAGMQVLRQYYWRRDSQDDPPPPREDVRVTVREGTTVYTNVALHLKGSAGSFRPIDSDEPPALTLNFDKFAKGQRFHGLQKIHLNNSVQDPSYVSEIICRELFAKAGVPVTRASHIVANLNGRGPQLYVLVEGWNKQFLKRHFKNAKGNLYDGGFAKDISFPLEVQSGDHRDDRKRLEELAHAATNTTPPLRPISDVLDVDQFLTFLAMEILTVHWDGYGMNRNNYRVFHDLDSNKMVFLPHGLDQMFGQWRSRPESPITPMMKGVVARAVMSEPALRKRYLDRMGQMLTNVLDYAAITNRAGALTRRVQPHLLKNVGALGNQELAANAFCNRIERRIRSVRQQLVDATTPLRFNASGEALLSGWRNSFESGRPQFPRSQGEPDFLRVSSPGSLAYGSWRTYVLLEEGRYQFTGRVQTDNLGTNNVSRAGVSLRISGEKEPVMTVNAPEWTTLSYEFEVRGLRDIELVCEFRASRGSAEFDRSSLKLVRKSPAK
jgi:spore coat protein H